jgi:hypothetical protein
MPVLIELKEYCKLFLQRNVNENIVSGFFFIVLKLIVFLERKMLTVLSQTGPGEQAVI